MRFLNSKGWSVVCAVLAAACLAAFLGLRA
jgi:hypothetical protein